MKSEAGSKFLFYRASHRKAASHFSGRILGRCREAGGGKSATEGDVSSSVGGRLRHGGIESAPGPSAHRRHFRYWSPWLPLFAAAWLTALYISPGDPAT